MPPPVQRPQSFASHRALPAPVYSAGLLILIAAVGIQAWQVVCAPSLASITVLLVFATLVTTHYWARRYAQIVQDRLILLEMRLRLDRLLPGRDAWRGCSRPQLIALRFAGDGELPALVERVAKGELVKPDDIKRRITDWQPDWHRV